MSDRSVARTRARVAVGEGLFWVGVLALVTAALVPVRTELDKAHVAMVLLLVVLGAGARGGRVLGVAAGVLSFIVFDWFFLPPYSTLRLADPLDWLVLVTFLVTSIVAAELLHRQREATRRAQSEALKDALIASVSHDLRTPLTTIKALAHELRSLGDERSQIIEEQADRLSRYVADLLDLARINAGQMPVRTELNAVDDLLAAALEETTGAHGGKGAVDVRVEPSSRILVGRFDLAMSVRIVANLIDNARKYGAADGAVEIMAGERDGRLAVAVADRGPGIPAAEAERIFAAFYRPHGATPDSGSAGLGLALARRMAEIQGGTLTYAARPGGGAEFTLVLPLASAEDDLAAERASRSFVKS